MMEKQAEERIERRLRKLFSDGMPKTAVDKEGLQTRGSFLRERPASPFRVLRKRGRGDTHVGTEKCGNGEGEEEMVKKDVCERQIGEFEDMNVKSNEEICTSETRDTGEDEKEISCEGSGCSSASSASVESGSDSGEGDGNDDRTVFRRLVETNRQYRERLLRG